jgi:hypothetical protein
MFCLWNICLNTLYKGDEDDDDNVDNIMMAMLLLLMMMMIRREKICKSTSCVVKGDINLALINEQKRKDKIYTCIHIKYMHCFLHDIICNDAICISLFFVLNLQI